MKKTTAFVAVAMFVASLSNSLFAQNSKSNNQKGQGSQRTMVQPGGSNSQRLMVQPGFQQPAPRLGFHGQVISGYGMKVLSVNWGSAAQRAGLESGDIIMRVNGRNIRSKWDYDQALRDAANYNYGQVNLKVRNVRYDWGYNVPMFAFVNTVLDGFGGPVGPIGPVVPASPAGPIELRSKQNAGHQHFGHSVVQHKHR